VPLYAFHVSLRAYLRESVVFVPCMTGIQGFAGIFGAGPKSGTMAIVFGEMGGHGSCDGEMEGAKHGSSDGAEGRKVEKVDVGAKRMGQCHAVGTLTSLRVSIIWWGIGGFIFQMVADYMLI